MPLTSHATFTRVTALLRPLTTCAYLETELRLLARLPGFESGGLDGTDGGVTCDAFVKLMRALRAPGPAEMRTDALESDRRRAVYNEDESDHDEPLGERSVAGWATPTEDKPLLTPRSSWSVLRRQRAICSDATAIAGGSSTGAQLRADKWGLFGLGEAELLKIISKRDAEARDASAAAASRDLLRAWPSAAAVAAVRPDLPPSASLRRRQSTGDYRSSTSSQPVAGQPKGGGHGQRFTRLTAASLAKLSSMHDSPGPIGYSFEADAAVSRRNSSPPRRLSSYVPGSRGQTGSNYSRGHTSNYATGGSGSNRSSWIPGFPTSRGSIRRARLSSPDFPKDRGSMCDLRRSNPDRWGSQANSARLSGDADGSRTPPEIPPLPLWASGSSVAGGASKYHPSRRGVAAPVSLAHAGPNGTAASAPSCVGGGTPPPLSSISATPLLPGWISAALRMSRCSPPVVAGASSTHRTGGWSSTVPRWAAARLSGASVSVRNSSGERVSSAPSRVAPSTASVRNSSGDRMSSAPSRVAPSTADKTPFVTGEKTLSATGATTPPILGEKLPFSPSPSTGSRTPTASRWAAARRGTTGSNASNGFYTGAASTGVRTPPLSRWSSVRGHSSVPFLRRGSSSANNIGAAVSGPSTEGRTPILSRWAAVRGTSSDAVGVGSCKGLSAGVGAYRSAKAAKPGLGPATQGVFGAVTIMSSICSRMRCASAAAAAAPDRNSDVHSGAGSCDSKVTTVPRAETKASRSKRAEYAADAEAREAFAAHSSRVRGSLRMPRDELLGVVADPELNGAVHPRESRVWHDMKLPLAHYLIFSSHNTYLIGEQVMGVSMTSAYSRAIEVRYRVYALYVFLRIYVDKHI